MSLLAFDTLAYSESMQKAGFTREQADAMSKANAEAFRDMVVSQQLATKQDIAGTKQEIAEVRQEITNLRHDFEIALANTKHDILKWMVTGMVAQCALLVGILAFLK